LYFTVVHSYADHGAEPVVRIVFGTARHAS
jgi:hypothetical protein